MVVNPSMYKVLYIPISVGARFLHQPCEHQLSYYKTQHALYCLHTTDFRVRAVFIFLLREANKQCFFHGASKDDKISELDLYLTKKVNHLLTVGYVLLPYLPRLPDKYNIDNISTIKTHEYQLVVIHEHGAYAGAPNSTRIYL